MTCFCFYGGIGFNFFFNLLFTYRYCRHLEEGSFRGRTADFLFMFIFGSISMIIIALFVNIVFLGSALTIMIVYIWSRRNPYVRMNFFGLLNFQAPYLPWVLFAFSLLLGNSVIVDLMGIIVGHIYYFLEDIFPHQHGGFKLLKTPRFLYVIIVSVIESCFYFFCSIRHWLFDETRRATDDNDIHPNAGNHVPFGAGGFHWE